MTPNTAEVRIAIIGCGRMGSVHAERIREDSRGHVVAVFDPCLDSAAQLREKLASECRVCFSLPELLETDADAVVICTPTNAHAEQVQVCVQRGWHILCEKPLAENLARIQELIALARQTSLHLMLGYQRRFWSTYRTILRELQSGEWGRIRAVTMHNIENWQQTIEGTWRDDPEINWGGFLGDAGSHKLDILFHTTGMTWKEMNARTWNMGSRVEVVALIDGLLTDGEREVPLSLDFIGNGGYLGEDFHLHCERGDLMVRDRQVWTAKNGIVQRMEFMESDSNPTIGFLDLLTRNLTNPAPFECAWPVYEMTAAILESSRTGTIVTSPL